MIGIPYMHLQEPKPGRMPEAAMTRSPVRLAGCCDAGGCCAAADMLGGGSGVADLNKQQAHQHPPAESCAAYSPGRRYAAVVLPGLLAWLQTSAHPALPACTARPVCAARAAGTAAMWCGLLLQQGVSAGRCLNRAYLRVPCHLWKCVRSTSLPHGVCHVGRVAGAGTWVVAMSVVVEGASCPLGVLHRHIGALRLGPCRQCLLLRFLPTPNNLAVGNCPVHLVSRRSSSFAQDYLS